jgi:hypothetical protein
MILFGMMLGALALGMAMLLYLMWRICRHQGVWWRWPALIGISLGVAGAGISLWQFLTGVLPLL